jgi:hypothetical protein
VVLNVVPCVGPPWGRGCGRWSHLPMSCAAEVPTIFGLVAAVLNLHHVPTELGVGRFFRCVGRP